MSTIGIEMALSIVVGLLAGRWLDQKLGTGFLQWAGFVLGVVAAFRSLYRLARVTREQLKDPQDPPP